MGKKKALNPADLRGQEKQVYDALNDMGTLKPTSEEVAAATGLDPQQVAAACYSLRKKGLVRSEKVMGQTTDNKRKELYRHSLVPAGAPPQKQSELRRVVKKAKKAKEQPLADRLHNALVAVDAAMAALRAAVEDSQAALKNLDQLKAWAKAQ
jgi:hypothetical protein